jgi:uncharacterized protein YggE
MVELRFSGIAVLLLVACAVEVARAGDCCTVNTISTVGAGKVTVQADISTISITVRGNDTTTSAALNRLNTQVKALIGVFAQQGLPTANYSTSSINFNQIYDYSKSPYVATGAEATQTFRVTIGNLPKLGAIITAISKVNVTLDNIVFEASNTTAALTQARKAAYADAKKKYDQYLTLTGLKSVGLKKMTDLNSEGYNPFVYDYNLFALGSKLQVPVGNPTVTATVEVVWNTRK